MKYKYRVVEYPTVGEVIHPEVGSEHEACSKAAELVLTRRSACLIERYNGERWQRGNIRYFWNLGHVCAWSLTR